MNTNEQDLLDQAVQAIHASEPDAGELSAASRRIADRLQESKAWLSDSRGTEVKALDWRSPLTKPVARAPFWKSAGLRWAALPTLASAVLAFTVYDLYFRELPGVQAAVESVDGAAFRISGSELRPIAAGEKLAAGDRVRTGGGAHAVLRLNDGTAVELNERSVVGVDARGRDTNILLENGDVIVQAAHREHGHLYVKTADLRAAVKGTIFAVDAGIKGSSVAVLQGAVDVNHAGTEQMVQAGDQMATYQTASYTPVAQQISWSHDRARYVALLGQLASLEHRLATVAFPAARYSSDLLGRMPVDTSVYVSIPNLGEALSQANRLLQDEMQKSPELREWFDGQGKNHTDELNAMVAKLHDMSGYLGDEVVLVGHTSGAKISNSKDVKGSDFALVADVRRSGLADYLRTQFAAGKTGGGLTVLDEQSLATAVAAPKSQNGGYALVRDREVVFSGSLATLRDMNAHLTEGPSGFATNDFGREITGAYGRGAGVIVAADLHSLGGAKAPDARLQTLGSAPRFLLVEHRELNGEPENHLTLEFAGQRQGIASWLAAPAPIGSLSFVSPNAAVAVAVLAKDPKAIADDLLGIMNAAPTAGTPKPSELAFAMELRNAVAANLGGDFLAALDGPVLPTPSWKIVAEVTNADGLEQALERYAALQQSGTALRIDRDVANGQTFYALVKTDGEVKLAEYTFTEGYLVVAANRALVLEAMHTRATGMSLARSASFKAQLPRDANENYSAVAYQNLSPVLGPLLSQFSGSEADTIRQLAADAKPTAICAWGKGDRIEAGSNSHLLGSNLLELLALVHPEKEVRRK